MPELQPEDAKLVTLARSARGRTGAAEGAAVRDTDGRTYVAATVDLPSLKLSALQVAVATAVSSGVEGLEAAAVVSGRRRGGRDGPGGRPRPRAVRPRARGRPGRRAPHHPLNRWGADYALPRRASGGSAPPEPGPFLERPLEPRSLPGEPSRLSWRRKLRSSEGEM